METSENNYEVEGFKDGYYGSGKMFPENMTDKEIDRYDIGYDKGIVNREVRMETGKKIDHENIIYRGKGIKYEE